ncbi:MAG: hypothetical protein M1371_00675 [Actinobacteria bacterium]|nr:hypothetical protein [Actinomycetota bacterium]
MKHRTRARKINFHQHFQKYNLNLFLFLILILLIGVSLTVPFFYTKVLLSSAVLILIILLLRYFEFDDRYFIGLALVLLVLCPFFLIFKKEVIAERLANYAYYFLVIGIFFMIYDRLLKNHKFNQKSDESFKALSKELFNLKPYSDSVPIFLLFLMANWIFILYSKISYFMVDTILFQIIIFLVILVRNIEIKVLFKIEIYLVLLNLAWIFVDKLNSSKINAFFFILFLIPIIYPLIKERINRKFLMAFLYLTCFIFIWINIPLIFTSQVNNIIFTFNRFNKIPDEYNFLKNDVSSFKVVDLSVDENSNVKDATNDFYGYFHKKEILKIKGILEGNMPGILELFNENYLEYLGKSDVKYIVFSFEKGLPEGINGLLSNRNYKFIKFGDTIILENHYFEPPKLVNTINDLIIVNNGENNLEETLVRNLYAKNLYVYLNSNKVLNKYYNEIKNKDFLIPIDINDPVGAKVDKKFDLLYVIKNAFIKKSLKPSEEIYIPVEVYNLGRKVLNRGNDDSFRLSYHWQDSITGQIIEYSGLRTKVPYILLPGDKVKLELLVKAPKKEGTYNLIIDGVVDKGEPFWFSNRGVNGLVVNQFEISKDSDINVNQSIQFLSNRELSSIPDPHISYDVNIPVETDYILLINKNFLNGNQDIHINIDGKDITFTRNNFDYNYFDDFVILGKIKLSNGYSYSHYNYRLTFSNLNFLKNSEGVRTGNVMYLLSVDNITDLVPNDVYQIIETKGKENNLSWIKMKVLKPFIFVLNQKGIEKKKIYTDDINIDNFVLIRDFYDTKLLFVKKPGIYDLYIRN